MFRDYYFRAALFFREMAIQHPDRPGPASGIVGLFDFEFLAREVYLIELWYHDEWLIDQRLDIVLTRIAASRRG